MRAGPAFLFGGPYAQTHPPDNREPRHERVRACHGERDHDRLAGRPAPAGSGEGVLRTVPRCCGDDFWNLEKYPGPRALRRSARYTLEIALLADGVAPRDVYKMLATRAGVDRAFRKLDRIKAEVRWWQAPSQPSVWLALGDVAMSSSEAFWIDSARAHGKELEIVWNGNLYEVNSWAIPKHAPHVADAYRFIAFASKAENQKVFAESIAYGPTNSGTVGLLDATLAGTLPAGDNLKAAFAIDESFWAQRGKALEERFEKWAPPIR